jgi:hypothetical protein
MSKNPFSSKPTIVEEVEQDDDGNVEQPDSTNPTGVQEDYDEVDTQGEPVEDEENEADEEWAQTPTGLYAEIDQDKFWWVFVTLKEDSPESENRRGIPVVEERFDTYDELVDAREDTDKEIPEGIHVQSKNSNKIRYVKGRDEQDLLKGRDLV